MPHQDALVGNLEFMASGRFFDPRLKDANRFPIAAAAGFDNVFPTGEDRVTPVLAALQMYQLSLVVPKPPRGSFDSAAAKRGKALFAGKADCLRCHTAPLYTEPGYNLRTPEEIGIDNFQSERSPTQRYRTTPLRGIFTKMDGGFYHDGRFPTLGDVVDHYNGVFGLDLATTERDDLIEFLKSL